MVSFSLTSISIEHTALVATILFSILSFWGLFHQVRQIVRLQSVRSLLPSVYIINAFVYFSGLTYGYLEVNWAIFLNGLLVIPYLWLHHTLYKMRAFHKKDAILIIFLSFFIGAMILTPHHGVIYLALTLSSLIGYSAQLVTLYNSGATGALCPRLFAVGVLSATTWMVYAYSSQEPILMLTAPASLILNAFILTLWCRYWIQQRQSKLFKIVIRH